MDDCAKAPVSIAHAPEVRKRILIVDDQAVLLKVLRASLEHHGFIVCGEAENGIDAVGRAVATRPDLVILDVAMPGLNGIEVASILQGLLPNTPIILHTIYGERIGTSLKSLVGIKAVVAKSEGVGKLIERVRSLTNGSVGNLGPSSAPSTGEKAEKDAQ
jgi:DNA-binding NarL/FixJ family response regulator